MYKDPILNFNNIPIPDRILYLVRELTNHFYEEIRILVFSNDSTFIDYIVPVINNNFTKESEIFKEISKENLTLNIINTEVKEKNSTLFIFIIDIEDIEFYFDLIRETSCRNFNNIILIAFIEVHKRFEQWKLFDAGISEVILKPFSIIELLARLYNILKMLYYKKNAEKFALEDSLTGLYNRRYFDIVLEEEVLKAYRTNSSVSLILIDIDSFKLYNDKFGHNIGDEILSLLGAFLKTNIRKGIDRAFRIGGDEFAIVVPDSLEVAVNIANRLASRWEEVNQREVSLSIGVSELKKDLEIKQAIQELFKNADKAMYESKKVKSSYISIIT
ncbi:MAG: diguanylate cyclase [Candidatus Aenigmatarchaeota archaeon]